MSFLICEVSLSHLSALPSHSSPLIGYCYYQVTRWEGSGVNGNYQGSLGACGKNRNVAGTWAWIQGGQQTGDLLLV